MALAKPKSVGLALKLTGGPLGPDGMGALGSSWDSALAGPRGHPGGWFKYKGWTTPH